MKWSVLMKQGLVSLADAGITDAKSDIRILAMYVLSCDYSGLILHMEDEVEPSCESRFWSLIDERRLRCPCQYITGSQSFMGYDFAVEPCVLIPRPETELLVELAVKTGDELAANPGRELLVLDLCCGTGCIGISYALKRSNKDKVYLADISDAATALADKNNERLNAGCVVLRSDLFDNIDRSFDMIISNPPYICSEDIPKLAEEVRDYEPLLALDGGIDGLSFYRRIIDKAGDYLNDNGRLLFEIGYNQFEDIRGLLVDAGYSNIQLVKDYAGLDRIVSACRG